MSRSVQSRKAISIASVTLFGCWFAIAQNPQLEEKVMALKQHHEINKQKRRLSKPEIFHCNPAVAQ